MKTKTIITTAIFVAFSFMGLQSCKEQRIEVGSLKNTTTVELNKNYLLSFDYNTEDPFKLVKVYNVKVIGIKKGYVQYQFDNGLKQSTTISLFKEITKMTIEP